MTALVWQLQPELCGVATDTLSRGPEGRPLRLVTKVLPIPHLRAVAAVTGDSEVLAAYAYRLMSVWSGRMVYATDVLGLDQVTPALLREIRDGLGIDESYSSTLYLFGFDPRAGAIVGRRYASLANFASEPLKVPSAGFKPGVPHLANTIQEILDNPDPKEPAAAAVRVISMLKEHDDALPPRNEATDPSGYTWSVGIGGEVLMTMLSPSGVTTFVAHRFPDADQQAAEIYARHQPQLEPTRS